MRVLIFTLMKEYDIRAILNVLAVFFMNFKLRINQKMPVAVVAVIWDIENIFARFANRGFHNE